MKYPFFTLLLFLSLCFPAFAGVPEGEIKGEPTTARLDERIEREHFWEFGTGRDFPGAKGSMTVVMDQPEKGQSALKMEGDFTKGGLYVIAARNFDEFGLGDLTAIKLKVKAENAEAMTVRLIDGTGQAHQKKGIPVVADGRWHEMVIKPSEIAGGEHWGGANDGKWQGAPKTVAFILTKPRGEDKKSTLSFSDIRAEGTLEVKINSAAFQADFEDEKLENWATEGSVTLDATEAFKGRKSLGLTLGEDNVRQKTSAAGPSFPVSAGAWEIKLAAKSDLTSQDSSYNGSVALEFLDGGGKPLGETVIAEQFKKSNWQPVSKRVDVPANAVASRFVARINKETPGKFWVDGISASAIVARHKDERIQRLMFTTAQTGNLLLPEDPKTVTLTVWATRPLPPEQQKVSCVVSDYWGAEQAKPLAATLERKGKQQNFFVYEGTIDLSGVPLEIGRYYELHGEIMRTDADPFQNHTSFAILPKAAAGNCKPGEIPFTSRNWDNRLPDFIKLTERLGIRICGGWVKWDFNPPQQPVLSQAELLRQQGLGVLVTTPAMPIELRAKNWEKWDETALRTNIRNFIQKFGDIHPLVINLGNEPHSKGEDVKIDVNAYRILYDEIKKTNPDITVVGTSVGPVEDYFKAGLGEWCDAYDFHVYESAENVRRILDVDYPALFKKYGFAKPVWSTELGLNSQGMARITVASELYKKFVNFFAGGGANVSWFGLLYPDSNGSQADSFSSAHNVFDCRYNKYAPKLDAIAYYNAVNGIAAKKFLADKVYGENLHAFLFRDHDGQTLQVLYKDRGREDVFLPLSGAQDVQLIRIDGRRDVLDAGGRGLSLTVGEDPILLLYKGGEDALPASLEKPGIELGKTPASIVRGEQAAVEVALNSTPGGRVDLRVPPFWKVVKSETKDASGRPVARFTLDIPEDSSVREADITAVLKNAAGRPCGEISYRPAVTGMISMQLQPVPFGKDTPPAVKLVVHNNSPQPQSLAWDLALSGERALKAGLFGPPGSSGAYFSETPSGSLKLGGRESAEITVPLAGIDPFKVYGVAATVRDASGRIVSSQRTMGGFVAVPKAQTPPALDGTLDESAWENAPVQEVATADQFYLVLKKSGRQWNGSEDLSAALKFLWDEQYLYIGVRVTDNAAGKLQKDDLIWRQDGLQMVIDPDRGSAQKKGKYDYGMAVGENGPQAWCFLSADPAVEAGNAKDIKVSVRRKDEKTGDISYEIAIPWRRLAPFTPQPGADLGLTLAINDDDGPDRDAFMTWFGSVQTKDVDTVADLILQP